jgi:hypothetical protein
MGKIKTRQIQGDRPLFDCSPFGEFVLAEEEDFIDVLERERKINARLEAEAHARFGEGSAQQDWAR